MSNSTRCAACRCLRRRCSEDCILAPFFPSANPERFACVHRIFGASNVARMLQQIPVEQRREMADAIASEAYLRVQDPVYGSVGVISMLQREIDVAQRELAVTQAQIAMHAAMTSRGSATQASELSEMQHSLHQAVDDDDYSALNDQDRPFLLPGRYQPPDHVRRNNQVE